MTSLSEEETAAASEACDFCQIATADPVRFHRTDRAKFGEAGTLCRDCISTVMCEVAYADREYFEQIVKQARAELEPR